MQFYNLKTKSHVDVPDEQVRKAKVSRKTKSGEQVRYALTADFEGKKLVKFVEEGEYKSSKFESADDFKPQSIRDLVQERESYSNSKR